MQSPDMLARVVAEAQPLVTQRVHDSLTHLPPPLRDISLEHFGWTVSDPSPLPIPGKFVRARLVLVVGLGLGADEASLVRYAAGVELLHNFTLVYDDIMDVAFERRYRPTIWAEHGLNAALLAGLTILNAAYRQADVEAFPHGMIHFTRCVDALAVGQHRDLELEKRQGPCPVEEWAVMAEGKTASTFALSLALGALAAGADAERCERYWDLGMQLGVLFQMLDDCLDARSSSCGKTKPQGLSAKICPQLLRAIAEAEGAAETDAAVTTLQRDIVAQINETLWGLRDLTGSTAVHEYVQSLFSALIGAETPHRGAHPMPTIVETVTRHACEVASFPTSQAQPDLRLGMDMNADSLDRLEILVRCERDLHVKLSPEGLAPETTLTQLAAMLEAQAVAH